MTFSGSRGAMDDDRAVYAAAIRAQAKQLRETAERARALAERTGSRNRSLIQAIHEYARVVERDMDERINVEGDPEELLSALLSLDPDDEDEDD
jgi:hypothetical protein